MSALRSPGSSSSSNPVPSAGSEPELCWSVATESPLAGLQLARERGRLLAWDTQNALYLFNAQGELLIRREFEHAVRSAAICDDGQTVVVLDDRGALHWLDEQLQSQHKHPTHGAPLAIALESHGHCAAVSSNDAKTILYRPDGSVLSATESSQPLAHLCFLSEVPCLIGAADYGLAGCYGSGGDCLWEETFMSPVGGLAARGDGNCILLACYASGVARHGSGGQYEGTYRLDGLAAHVATSYQAEQFAVSDTHGGLWLLDYDGHILWQDRREGTIQALAIEPLGRFLFAGRSPGRIERWQWTPQSSVATAEH